MENMTIRFFTTVWDNVEGTDILEISESTFTELQCTQGDISYERHTMSQNGVNQVCLTIEADVSRDEIETLD